MASKILMHENANVLEIIGLADQISGTEISDATLTLSIYSKETELVLANATTISATYQTTTGKTGHYTFDIPKTVPLVPNQIVQVEIDCSNYDFKLVFDAEVQERSE